MVDDAIKGKMFDHFEPGFLIRVDCDLDEPGFSEWCFNSYVAIGLEKVSISMGRLGLHEITIEPNDAYNPSLAETEDGFYIIVTPYRFIAANLGLLERC